jgi:tetratricopeptide (TPR) repeat protein
MNTKNRLRAMAIGVPLLLLLGGCPASNRGIEQANEAFNRGEYLRTVELTQAIEADPQARGEDRAAALYLRGRALEELPAANDAEKLQNLAAARRAYVAALSHSPGKALEGRIRSGVANVAYHQEDYNTSMQQWTAAYELTDLPDQKPWILYRIGLSQQRLGQFDLADRTFAQVQQQYPGTEPANRAREKQGVRQFYVQVGVFAQAATAQKTIDALKRMGHKPLQSRDAQGRTVISVGPAPTWASARALQQRVAPQYPDAVIMP